MSIEERIKDYIARSFLFATADKVDPKASLLESGTIDSTGVIDLVLFLESEFKLKVADEELVPDNLDSVQKLSKFVERKLATTSKV